MEPKIARIYQRTFKTSDDAKAFIDATKIIEERVSAVDFRYRVYQAQENPLILFEVWEYPDVDAMEWVQASMEGAGAVPRAFNPDTVSYTADVAVAYDFEE